MIKNPKYRLNIYNLSTNVSMACERSVVSPGTMVSSTNKADRNDITDIVLKEAINTINQTTIRSQPRQPLIEMKKLKSVHVG
jgi:hypothetical protein